MERFGVKKQNNKKFFFDLSILKKNKFLPAWTRGDVMTSLQSSNAKELIKEY